MDYSKFIDSLLAAAKDAGIEAAEVYFASGDSFRAMTAKGEITNYTVNATCGLSLRGLVGGKMGYAATEAFDENAIAQLVRGVRESAALIEDDAVQEIYPGDKEYAHVDNYFPGMEKVSEQEKFDFLLAVEKGALAADPRIASVSYNMLETESAESRIRNTYGLDLAHRDNMAVAFLSVVAKDGDKVSTGTGFALDRDFGKLDAQKIIKDATDEALFMLKAEPVASGAYRAIIKNIAMPDLLQVFGGVFSADNAQQGMSLLAGREGERIAADIVTLMDDPLLPGGLSSRAFDAEGVATRTKPVIENGVLKTLLHNLKTARKAGVKTTGNASKRGYAGAIQVAPSNFFFQPGEKTLEELQRDMGDGIVITDLSGLHAGANAVSGDFSLLAKGYTVKDGKKDKPVEQITVAGNFYKLLESIRAVGSDLLFPGSGYGSPSIDAGEISVAGK